MPTLTPAGRLSQTVLLLSAVTYSVGMQFTNNVFFLVRLNPALYCNRNSNTQHNCFSLAAKMFGL